MKVVLASRNPGKLRELRALLPDWEIEPARHVWGGEEKGATFYENARLKALHARRVAPAKPGRSVRTPASRWTGSAARRAYARHASRASRQATRRTSRSSCASWPDWQPPTAGARYVCELVLVSPDGEEQRGTGTLEGADRPRAARIRRLRLRPRVRARRGDLDGRRARRRVEGGRESSRLGGAGVARCAGTERAAGGRGCARLPAMDAAAGARRPDTRSRRRSSLPSS